MTTPFNADTYPYGDAHKTWDIFIPHGFGVLEHLVWLYQADDENPHQTLSRIANSIPAKTAPPEVKDALRPYNPDL